MKRFFLLVLVLCPVILFAEAVAPGSSASATQLPAWFSPIMDMVTALPVAGPFLVSVLKYASIVSAVFTALTTFLLGLAAALVGVSNAAGLTSFANKVQSIRNGVFPWLAYLSMYNVQKNQGGTTATIPSPLSKA